MKEKIYSKVPIICLIIVLCLMAFGAFMAGYNYGKGQCKVERDTIEVKSTYKEPMAVAEKPVKVVKVVARQDRLDRLDRQDRQDRWVDSTLSYETLGKDCLNVEVPITQKIYKDSNYTAWVSGYLPKLDSIEVRSRTITYAYTKSVTKFHRLNVGLTGGYGYGFLSRKIEPFVGVGVTLSLFR